MMPIVCSEEGKTLRSGELAQLAGVSKDTLRHYERLGVLPPADRTDGGYRIYPAMALRRVLTIRAALGVGLSLAQLTEIYRLRDSGQPPCREVKRLVEERFELVDQQIQMLTQLRDRMSSLLVQWDERLDGHDPAQFAYLLDDLVSPGTPGDS